MHVVDLRRATVENAPDDLLHEGDHPGVVASAVTVQAVLPERLEVVGGGGGEGEEVPQQGGAGPAVREDQHLHSAAGGCR